METQDFKIGDLVKVALKRPFQDLSFSTPMIGIVTRVKCVDDLFSEKYAIIETETYVDVLCDGEIVTFTLGEDLIEKVAA